MIQLRVDLGQRTYPIMIGQDLLSHPQLFLPYLNSSHLMIVSNHTVAPLYLSKLQDCFPTLKQSLHLLPEGEQYKNVDAVMAIITTMLQQHCDRKTTLLALGGGVVGDIAGFAAASYQRGITFIQIPTTLLSQVDSSVGGKTGVNHPLGKNMVGAFHQPAAVIVDIDTLDTLPRRELVSGLAEVIKYGLINDYDFFCWLEDHIDALLARDHAALVTAIERSCSNKARIVAQDEREQGCRALLNLGHSFGHAIEAGLGYGNWLHGEAISAGICLAARLSCAQGWLDRQQVTRICGLLKKTGLPVRMPKELSAQRILALMSNDKKVACGRLRLVLFHSIGDCFVSSDFDYKKMQDCLGQPPG
ncbi:MAG TPA: 3-dehydroquinate synthase [Gammaproteobacteria bacterium]|nr:3-dehydroquinate synthase [Gammaproteobacteria bacterium]